MNGNSYRSILKGASVFGGVQVVQVLLNLVRGKFVAMFLGPDGMGVSSLFSSSSLTLQKISSLGLNLALVKEVASAADDRARMKEIMAVARLLITSSALLGAILCIGLAPWLSRLTFGGYGMTLPFMSLGVAVGFSVAFAGNVSVLQGLRRLKDISLCSIAGGITGVAAGVPLYYFFGTEGIVPAMGAMAFVMWIFSYISVRKMDAWRRVHFSLEAHRGVVFRLISLGILLMANDPRRPIGSFIFLGTTGVGKTELAKALAEYLFDDEDMMTRIDMSEYMEKHSVSRLVGAPPGYVGYEEGGQLTEAVRRKPYSVVLFDEIEKANPDVFNILLQVLDDGRLTDNKGRFINFKNTIIIMTSNEGSPIIRQNFADMKDENRQEVIDKTKQDVMDLLKMKIRPEFLNRIDEIVMFTPLNKKEIQEIVDLQVNSVRKMLASNGVTLEVTKPALELLAEDGYDPEFGARPVKRTIQRMVLNQLSKDILAQKVDREHPIIIDRDGDELVFKN